MARIEEIINDILVVGKLQIDEPALTFPERIEFRRLGSWEDITKKLSQAIKQELRRKVESIRKMHSQECNLWHDVGGIVRHINREGFQWKCNCGIEEHNQALTKIIGIIKEEL